MREEGFGKPALRDLDSKEIKLGFPEEGACDLSIEGVGINQERGGGSLLSAERTSPKLASRKNPNSCRFITEWCLSSSSHPCSTSAKCPRKGLKATLRSLYLYLKVLGALRVPSRGMAR